MFIKVKGFPRDEKDPNIQMEHLININHIRSVLTRTLNAHTNKYAVYTDMNTIYTDDDVPTLIQKRMATPFDGVIPEAEKREYRDPVLPQDADCFAEFSDDQITWYEGYLVSYSDGSQTNKWGGRFVHGTAYYKYARITVWPK